MYITADTEEMGRFKVITDTTEQNENSIVDVAVWQVHYFATMLIRMD
jgi:hypothetical protein